jgi:hypothetical protein
MRKNISKIVISALLFTFSALPVFAITCIEGRLPGDLEALLTTIRNVLAGAGIVIAAIFLILGGYSFITAGGAPEKVETARRQIMYALIGVAIILLAAALVGIVESIVC